MKNNNMTLKEALNFVESVEYLQETNEEEFRRIRSEMVDLLELQILKNEFIENISKYNNLRNLKILNGVLKRLMKDETDKKTPMEQVQEIEMKIYKNMLDNDVI